MSLILRAKGFAPGWRPSLAVLLLLPLLLSLGLWQLERADEKTALQTAYNARNEQAPIALLELAGQADLAYRRVRLEGFFDPEHSLLLDNRMRNGQVGVELLQPFFDQLSGRWLLVNRGWLPWLDRRQAVSFTTPEQPLALSARIYMPSTEPFQLGQVEPVLQWPRLITKVEPSALWQQLGRTGEAYELRLEPGPASYLAQWPVVAMSVDKHYGYAVQWFALAAALIGLYIYLGVYNARQLREEQEHDTDRPRPASN